MKVWLWRGLALVVVLMVGAVLGMLYQANKVLDQELSLPPQGMIINIKPGTSFRTVAKDLEDKEVLSSDLYLYAFARITSKASKIKAGEFHIPQGTTGRKLLEVLRTARPVQYSLTLVEGWNFKEIMAAIHKHEALEHTLKGLKPLEIMERLGYKGEHPEGRFFPDTYAFEKGMTDADFLRRAYKSMKVQLDELWKKREAKLPLKSPYEALILASIVEKETGVKYERPEIAGVFVRRLRKGMRLQTDPTVIYGMGDKYKGNIRKKDLRTDTPYNTYTRKGLPPTPICMPGRAAIKAALHPKKGKSLYFVSKGDGSHYFSASLKEHNRAVRKYQLRRRKK